MRGARRWVDGGALPRCRRRARTPAPGGRAEGVCMVQLRERDGPDRVIYYSTPPHRNTRGVGAAVPFAIRRRCAIPRVPSPVVACALVMEYRFRGRAGHEDERARYRRDKRLTAYTSAPATTEHTRRVSRVLGSSRFSSNHCSDRGSQSCLASQPSPPSRGLSQQLLLTAPAIAAGLCAVFR